MRDTSFEGADTWQVEYWNGYVNRPWKDSFVRMYPPDLNGEDPKEKSSIARSVYGLDIDGAPEVLPRFRNGYSDKRYLHQNFVKKKYGLVDLEETLEEIFQKTQLEWTVIIDMLKNDDDYDD